MALLDSIKNIAATVGVVLPLGGIYTMSGLPVPATISQVETRIQPIKDGMQSLQITVLQGQLESLRTRRNFLRADLYALDSARPPKDAASSLINQRRKGQIGDELADIDRQYANISGRIEELSARPWQEPKATKS